MCIRDRYISNQNFKQKEGAVFTGKGKKLIIYSEEYIAALLFQEIQLNQKKDFFANHLVAYINRYSTQLSDEQKSNKKELNFSSFSINPIQKIEIGFPPTWFNDVGKWKNLEGFRFNHKNIENFNKKENNIVKLLLKFLNNKCYISFKRTTSDQPTAKINTTTYSAAFSSVLVNAVFNVLNIIYSAPNKKNQLTDSQKRYFEDLKVKKELAQFALASEEDKRDFLGAATTKKKGYLRDKVKQLQGTIEKVDKFILASSIKESKKRKENIFLVINETFAFSEPINSGYKIKQLSLIHISEPTRPY